MSPGIKERISDERHQSLELLCRKMWQINEASIDPTQLSAVHHTLRYLQGTPLWVDLLQGAAVVLIVVSLLSLAGYVLSYWGFRLTRHPGGTLQVSRGLLTTRATSIPIIG